jgi:hypothetical protein
LTGRRGNRPLSYGLQYELAADSCDFGYLRRAAVCAGCAARHRQVEGADAQKVVSIISSDKAKTQTFCQMVIVGKQIDESIQEKDNKKAAELAQKLNDLEKNLGPEHVALVDALRNTDLNSKEAQEIISTFDTLDDRVRIKQLSYKHRRRSWGKNTTTGLGNRIVKMEDVDPVTPFQVGNAEERLRERR